MNIPSYNKFSAKKTEVDGIVFASKREAARYQELKLMEKAGLISVLACQRTYDLYVGEKRIGKYVADFVYLDESRPVGAFKQVVEDCKGFRTPLYRWKKKHFEAQYGISIKET